MMQDRALANAENKRKQILDRKKNLLKELAEIDEQVEQIDRFIRAWHAFAGDEVNSAVGNLSDSTRNVSEQSLPAKRKATGNSSKEEVAAAARDIIVGRSAPIMRDELYDLLTDRGLVIQGKDPKMVLSTMLWRMKNHIVRLPNGGYWPTDIPNEAIGYKPAPTEVRKQYEALQEKLQTLQQDLVRSDPTAEPANDAVWRAFRSEMKELEDEYICLG